jgi:hypothetical protein
MSLQVIGAGFGRTGTMSLKTALLQLGYIKTHHMDEVLPSAEQRRLWQEVAEGLAPDWDAIFDGFTASVDFPSSSYYKELLAHYPDAKVVLTVRDPDSWYKSASETIYAIGKAPPLWARKIIKMQRQIESITQACVWQRVFDGQFEDKAKAIQIFQDHIEQVKADVPADQLLIFEVKQGWGPLCAFLGQPVPSTPFPHVNDTVEFKRMIRKIRLSFAAVHAMAAAIVAALIWYALS